MYEIYLFKLRYQIQNLWQIENVKTLFYIKNSIASLFVYLYMLPSVTMHLCVTMHLLLHIITTYSPPHNIRYNINWSFSASGCHFSCKSCIAYDVCDSCAGTRSLHGGTCHFKCPRKHRSTYSDSALGIKICTKRKHLQGLFFCWFFIDNYPVYFVTT